MSERTITIRNRITNDVLATAVADKSTRLFEGAWYFDPETVDLSQLEQTERTYICPYKGICYWLDLKTPTQTIENAGFTYFDVKPGYEFIQDKIGLYAGTREATTQE